MHAKTEGALQRYINKQCKQFCIACYKFASPSRRGVPDLLLLYNGRVVFVELKSPAKTGVLSPLQHYELELLVAHDAEVYVIDEYEKADELITLICNDKRAAAHGRPPVRLRPYTTDR